MTLRDFLRDLSKAAEPLIGALKTYYSGLEGAAEIFRELLPLGTEGWALSTFGMIVAPAAHRRAADRMASHPAQAQEELEAGWSDESARRQVSSLVPYVYPPEQRALAERRQELLDRASEHYTNGSYEEAVLLVYSQLDGIFQDKADAGGEKAFAKLFSRAPVQGAAGDNVRQFADLVADSESMAGTEDEFFLIVRDAMTESVKMTTLEDHPSRHGVLHGRVLGYGTRRRAAQAFAFLTACLELLLVLDEDISMTKAEAFETDLEDLPEGLKFILFAQLALPVRSVYLYGRDRDLLVAEVDEPKEGAGNQGLTRRVGQDDGEQS
jgi:hypothetical protein